MSHETIYQSLFVQGKGALRRELTERLPTGRADGPALASPLQREVLDPLPGFTSFPDDYFTFWPDGQM